MEKQKNVNAMMVKIKNKPKNVVAYNINMTGSMKHRHDRFGGAGRVAQHLQLKFMF